jgi:hypothetical protein
MSLPNNFLQVAPIYIYVHQVLAHEVKANIEFFTRTMLLCSTSLHFCYCPPQGVGEEEEEEEEEEGEEKERERRNCIATESSHNIALSAVQLVKGS